MNYLFGFLGQTHTKVSEATVGQTRPQAARAAVGLALLREHIIFCRIAIFASSFFFAACGSFRFCFAWDFNVSLTCELKKTHKFFRLEQFFSFRFASPKDMCIAIKQTLRFTCSLPSRRHSS
jgi:hypothetical protein